MLSKFSISIFFSDFYQLRAIAGEAAHEIGYTDSFLPIHTDTTFNQSAPSVSLYL